MLLFAQMGNVRKEIFLKGKKRTDDIISCVRSGKFYKITFKSHKTYTYRYFDVKIIEPSKEELFIDNRLDYFKSIAGMHRVWAYKQSQTTEYKCK